MNHYQVADSSASAARVFRHITFSKEAVDVLKHAQRDLELHHGRKVSNSEAIAFVLKEYERQTWCDGCPPAPVEAQQ